MMLCQAPRRKLDRQRPNLDYLPITRDAHEIVVNSPDEIQVVVSAAILAFEALPVDDQVKLVLAYPETANKRPWTVAVPVAIGAHFRAWRFPTLPMWRVLSAAITHYAALPEQEQAEWITESHVFATRLAREGTA